MIPCTSGDLSKAMKNLLRSGAEYEFDTESLSEDEEEMKEGDKEEEEITSPNISLKGILWRALGKETYEKWINYLLQGKNANEVLLSCKLYSKLLDDAFEYITETEADQLKKQDKQQNHTGQSQPKSLATNSKVFLEYS